MNGIAILEARGLCKSYTMAHGRIDVLRGATLSVGAGAKLKICAIYKRDIRLLRPVEKILLMIILHRELTLLARLASSPEE